MSQDRPNGSSRRENSVLFALRELGEIEQDRRRREEDERRRRDEAARHAREEEARRAARAETLRRAAAEAADRARAEAERKADAELAELRAELGRPDAAPPPDAARALPSQLPAPARRRLPAMVKATVGGLTVAALSLVGALVLLPREIAVNTLPDEGLRPATAAMPLPRYTAVPHESTAGAESAPATATTGHGHHGKHTGTGSPTAEDCRHSKDPTCGMDLGSAK
ncbi:MAG TPA: hypothetical protein VG389_15985 [Myxococcota bacterium]|jgi:hypothetical protein|nr:hypothetical protein [Myxococcota bacterium]